ncbi:hypothetical protein NA57DRAFT_38966 [Rhizodiscina lignyota]|uniref:Exocyst complex protein EXO70 n=1 Tax=Rhizodiscina lignyota TaxID=1504668 RepID=A0A9P4IG43_9PEZI|nr:hypothetical protein NA57DRAFT_38966 [Rhizodiscina lignyota]
MVAPRSRKAAFAEESAEVEVLFANMEKLKGLTKKIQGSLNRMETSGQSVKEAVGPIYGNTQKLQITNSNIDRIIDAIERIREPLDQRNREERIIQSDPKQTGLNDYIASLDRTNQALGDLKNTNLRSNQQAIAELNNLLTTGTSRLQDEFRDALYEHTRPVEPLHFITKQLKFPSIPEESVSRLRTIHNHITQSMAQTQASGEAPTIKIYAELRGDYMAQSLRNLATASMSTARKTTVDAIYRQGTSGIGTYATALEGIYVSEYDNICPIFSREDWGRVCALTCRASLGEFRKTLSDLNNHIKSHITTDCYLAFEIIEIVSRLSIRLESQMGAEIKQPIADAVRPIRDTAKQSISTLYDEPRTKVQSLVSLPFDGAAVPITQETMSRLQTMTAYLQPLSSLLTSLGKGGWATSPTGSTTSLPTLDSFDVGADGRQLFAAYAVDMLDSLVNALDNKGRALLKNKSVQGVFLMNNVAIIERMIRNSELSTLLVSVGPKMDSWKKRGSNMYLDSWRETSMQLMEAQHTSRARPPSGTQSGSSVDSAAVIKSLSSKEKDALKEKLKTFNANFDALIEKHRSYRMEKEVRISLAKDVQSVIEPLYARFWDRYHEIDKGKGKYIKYDKSGISTALAMLG